jgi:hypothetical protein
VLIALVASHGAVAQVWLSIWGVFLAAVVLIGVVAPLALQWRLLRAGALAVTLASTLVLIGGFLLRVVLVLSSESIRIGSLVLLAIALGALTGCTSPEATRTRAGGPGADPGNRGTVVTMHDGADPYHGTPQVIPPGR